MNKLIITADSQLKSIIKKDNLEDFISYINKNTDYVKEKSSEPEFSCLYYCLTSEHTAKKITNYLIDTYPEILTTHSKLLNDVIGAGNYAGVILHQINRKSYSLSPKNIQDIFFLRKIFKKIINNDTNFYINHVTNNGDNLLSEAISLHNLSALKFLIKAGFEINTINEKNGNNLLHIACENRNNKHVVKFLLNHKNFKNTINDKNFIGNTPFLIAQNTDIKFISFLLKKGADPLSENNNKINALHYFCQGFSFLNIWRSTAHNIRQYKKTIKYIDFLLEKGISINSIDSENNNALHYLAENKNNENKTGIIKKMCQLGINIYQTNNEGNNILHLLIGKHRLKELHFIMNKWKMPLNSRNSKNHTPLMCLFNSKSNIISNIVSANDFDKYKELHSGMYGKRYTYFPGVANKHTTESVFHYLIKQGFDKNELNAINEGKNILFKDYFFHEGKFVFDSLFENINFEKIKILKNTVGDINLYFDSENNNLVHLMLYKDNPKEDLYKKINWAIEHNINILHTNNAGISAISLLNDPIKEHEFTERYINLQKSMINKHLSTTTVIKQERRTRL